MEFIFIPQDPHCLNLYIPNDIFCFIFYMPLFSLQTQFSLSAFLTDLGEIQCEVNGQFRILYKEVSCNLYRSSSIVRVVNSRNSGLGMWLGVED
jgi:hypothetical protein